MKPVQITDVHEAQMLTFVNLFLQFDAVVGLLDKTLIVVTRKHQHVFRIETRNLAHCLHKVMNMNKILALHVDSLIHIFRQNRLQFINIAVAPKLEDIESERDEGVVALSMHLFSQKMHELVLPQPYLIHVGGDVTNLALRPYLIEIHREDA